MSVRRKQASRARRIKRKSAHSLHTIPRWVNCVTAVSAVVSIPPAWLETQTKTPAGLPTSALAFQRPPHASNRAFICAG